MVFDDLYVLKTHRDHTIQKIVVVSADVDDAGLVLHIQKQFDKSGVLFFPFGLFSTHDAPAIYNVTAKDQGVTGIFFRKRVAGLVFDHFEPKCKSDNTIVL